MINMMDQHPMDPSDQVSREPRPRAPRGRLLAATALVAVAAGTLGTGVYLNRESPTWQAILGTEPVVEAVPLATDQLPVLLDALETMTATPGASNTAAVATALQGTEAMLREHVDLLTPGIPGTEAASGDPATTAGAGEPTAPATATALTPAEFSLQLARTGNALLGQALGAPEQEARRLAGAGLDLLIQARTVLSIAGATPAQIDDLPAPDAGIKPATASPAESAGAPAPAASGATTDEAVLARMPAFEISACPAPAEAEYPDPDAPDSGRLLAGVADAAYRMGYAYDVAGARTSAGLRTAAWDRSELLVEFAHAVEARFGADLGCAPLRRAAYQLPADATANPMDAARDGEAQLALLLRDAAVTQPAKSRAYLFNAAWAQAVHARKVTGIAPDFTQVQDTALGNGAASAPPAG